MGIKTLSILSVLFLVIPGTLHPEPVSIPGMISVTAGVRETPPDWAVMQRHLIRTMEEAAPYYLERFIRRGDTPYGGGPYDDVYEMFYNWPLFYAIGADESILHRAIDCYNGITRRCTVYDPQEADYFHQLYNEFPRKDDWFHISEGMMALYDFGVANPANPENIDRACRFAELYMGENPEAQNYDPEFKIIRSPFTGSKGPLFETKISRYSLDPQYGWTTLYPILKDLEPDWDKSPERAKEIEKLYNKIVLHGDVAVNLAATSLMTNAYLYTGDEKYKKWVIDYVDVWRDRIQRNNGLIPDNTDLSGVIGGNRGGQWWGGFFGWTSRYSIHMIYGALSVAMECAYMLTGDPAYLEMLRSQIDKLMEQAITTKEGQMLVPYYYGPDGWTSHRPIIIRDLAHLWHASMSSEDWNRIEKVIKGNKFYPLPYSRLYLNENWKPEKPFDWNYVPSTRDRHDDNPAEFPRLMYYAGKNPDWPLRILKADYEYVRNRMEFMRNDKRDIYSINGDDLYPNNPVITKGLVQVTMGTPQSVYNGGLLRARVRYFDCDRARPGLPLDVAALVEDMKADRTVVHLVNISVMNTRRLIVQAGAFGEHEFAEMKYLEYKIDESGKKVTTEKTVPVNNKYFAVELPPATSIKLDIGTRRFVNKPSYAFPWHRGKDKG